MSTPTGFKRRLASELSAMATHSVPAPAPAPVTPALSRRLRVPLTAAAVVAAAVAAAVIVPTLGGSGGSPAYAVTRQDDGSLILHLNRAEGLDGLQKQLTSMGVRAVALEADESCAEGHPGAGTWATEDPVLTFPSDPGKAQIHPDIFPKDATLLLVAEFKGDGSVRAMTDWLVEKVPTCSLPGRQEE
ncbi:hypothetical protein [Streptomyces phaeochromogenes]|uniref:hypothetical protein n=1 Tax=Streptomyces phaeochromogenes TaxID=1923 RepID=UPI002DD926F6|nr:hypothetical protein [Streptomyces phaeochromogenes]WRZ30510.1 hypothetical protein OG931_23545 [Streptomyces phaeochromogenes]